MKLNDEIVHQKLCDDGSKLNIRKIKNKNRYFESYISKVLNHTSPNNGITSNAKQQLNSVICILGKEISKLSIQLTEISKKKTISHKEIINTIKIIFRGDLSINSIRESEKSIHNFTKINSSGGSRQGRAGNVFPPSIAEKFLRNFGYSKIMVTSTSPVCLATILEYFTAEILTSAVKYSNHDNRIRITIRDLELTVRNDIEFSYLFNKLNISFLGGGVIPFIHPCLLSKKIHKYKKKNTLDENKSHRFRPGTVAIREIKKYQKMSDCLTFSKSPFERLVRNLTFTLNNSINIKISKDVFIILQHFIEQYIISIIKDSNAAAIHSGRLKLILSDIEFICNIKKYMS